jgi:hypothetical protein
MLRALPLHGRLTGRRVVDCDELPVGRLTEVLMDADRRLWAAIDSGRGVHVAPLEGHGVVLGLVRLAHRRDHVEAAPDVAVDGLLADADLVRLEHHYGA